MLIMSTERWVMSRATISYAYYAHITLDNVYIYRATISYDYYAHITFDNVYIYIERRFLMLIIPTARALGNDQYGAITYICLLCPHYVGFCAGRRLPICLYYAHITLGSVQGDDYICLLYPHIVV